MNDRIYPLRRRLDLEESLRRLFDILVYSWTYSRV